MLHYLPDGEEDVPEEVDGDGRRQGEGGAVQTLAGVTGGNKTLISILCKTRLYVYFHHLNLMSLMALICSWRLLNLNRNECIILSTQDGPRATYLVLKISARTRTSMTSLLFSHKQFSSALLSW